jgi:putative transposase
LRPQVDTTGPRLDVFHIFEFALPFGFLDLMRELKKASCIWGHEQTEERRFAWQEGYAAFTVSATARDAVVKYIENQPKHHRQKSFREELIDLLRRADVEYDPKYLD